jgi:hypothetical protein
MRFTIRGVHPVEEATDPCHLIEAELSDGENFDWGKVTQEDATQPRDNWQVPYDEQPLDEDERRWAFFFHYLDLSKPLMTPSGPIQLPSPTPMPAHLKNIEYMEP